MEHVPFPFKVFAIGAAALMTTILCFFIMQLLINQDLGRELVPEVAKISAPVLPREVEPIQTPARTQADRFVPAELPPSPEGISIAPDEFVMMVHAERPMFASFADNIDHQAMDLHMLPPVSDIIPLYVVHPVYPFSAVMKEVEGYVVVSFTVRENGTVVNPVVIASEPDSVFEDAALAAVSKFKFQPRMVGGDSIPVEDLRMKFIFSMDSYADTGPRVHSQAVDIPGRAKP